jgi:hypothetical protein
LGQHWAEQQEDTNGWRQAGWQHTHGKQVVVAASGSSTRIAGGGGHGRRRQHNVRGEQWSVAAGRGGRR